MEWLFIGVTFFAGIGAASWFLSQADELAQTQSRLSETERRLSAATSELDSAKAELASTKADLADARERLRQDLHRSWNSGPKPAIVQRSDRASENAHFLNNWD